MKLLVCMGALLLASVSATFRRGGYQRKYLSIPLQPRIIGKLPHPFDSCFYNDPISATSYFDMNGIRGSIQFYQQGRDQRPVTIVVMIDGLDQFPDEMWGWHVHEYPVNFAVMEEEPCRSQFIGGHYDPTNVSLAEDYTERCAQDPADCEVGDLAGRHGHLTANQNYYIFEDYNLDLFDEFSPIGRSLLIHREGGFRFACANINYDARSRVETYVAPFPFDPKQQDNNIQGEIVLRRPQGRCGVTWNANLFRTDGSPDTMLGWSLRRGQPGANGDCSDLQEIVYGEGTYDIFNYDERCEAHQLNCYIGDLEGKCGPIETVDDNNLRNFCTDTQIARIPQSEINDLSVAIEDVDGEVIACSRFMAWQPRTARADVYNRGNRVWLNAFFYQEDPHDDTIMRAYMIGLDPNRCYYLQIRERRVTPDTEDCRNLGPVYEPRYGFNAQPPRSGVIQTGDKNFIGDLTDEVPELCGDSYYAFSRRGSYMPLFWEYDIVGRSLVLHDADNGEAIACANIEPYSGDVSDRQRQSLLGYHY